ncbi:MULTISPECIES: alpha/beta fold hydrolase [Mycolicibacterium]|jgi:pimeloyl-ACP methyl ester carboxylesterase|uniref:Esterase EstC, putative n=2 Tax=Mycolicibacterium TaxID=1866885 RepID=A1TCQ4_MYCVP|nr:MULTISPECIES: alpha/beta fold hydrolase [Mycolicibacterium]ABM14954.1 esterase EstC, putative [Mycolicibacterium vanbaalenii PYR-1]MCV7130631.1 alpha/beta hydrolase [Mycolicibacterium vanbaalenii PYR-1]MDN4521895.1 alpha/beta fold hydrolase [Mycolicibacterium austroafricanum]MDW5611119.1 alpha/beta fold hydrolase [Mycolicibacterium sp. D5.8-2]PQP46491.1 esterase [Mycolicibacterium austroafricanum]
MRFVLVHGGFHAAWCWERTIDALQALGHDAVAVDLPGHGDRVDEESTLANRREAVVAAMQAGGGKCVLVGHSGGGFDATLAADARPDLVHHIVYLAAALPREGRTYPEAMAMRDAEQGPAELGDEFDGDVGEMLGYLNFDEDGAMTFADFEGAWKYFYHDCDEATARWAFERLGPERFGDTTVTPVSVPDFWAADLPRSFIVCEQDRSMPRWLADTVARRLGVEQLTIDASHSPFLSRPRELAELLVRATTTTPVSPLVPH